MITHATTLRADPCPGGLPEALLLIKQQAFIKSNLCECDELPNSALRSCGTGVTVAAMAQKLSSNLRGACSLHCVTEDRRRCLNARMSPTKR